MRRLDGFDPDAASGAASPHPEQLAHPDHDVVICEAGCDGRGVPSSTCKRGGPDRSSEGLAALPPGRPGP